MEAIRRIETVGIRVDRRENEPSARHEGEVRGLREQDSRKKRNWRRESAPGKAFLPKGGKNSTFRVFLCLQQLWMFGGRQSSGRRPRKIGKRVAAVPSPPGASVKLDNHRGKAREMRHPNNSDLRKAYLSSLKEATGLISAQGAAVHADVTIRRGEMFTQQTIRA